MTRVELALLTSLAGAVAGALTRQHRLSRVLLAVSIAALVILLLVFGGELVGDLTLARAAG